MNLLVTGGAGYIGSHAARHLARAGHEVWVYDDCRRGHAEAAPPGRLVVGDVGDTALLASVLRGRRIEAVLHFAALGLVGEAESDPALYHRNNISAGLSMLETLRACGVQKIVFSSTTATYGAVDGGPISEDTPQHPVNVYGFTKLVFERALADAARAYGLGSVALRYFNAAGASADGTLGEDHEPETHLIPLVLQVALGQREKLIVFGNDYPTRDGTCVRDYVHVEDLARAHATALAAIRPGEARAFNLGSGRGHSVLEVIGACRRVTGHAIPIEIGPRRAGDPPELVADIRRAASELGWQPEYTSLDAIVATAWNWHRTHPHGYRGR